MSKKIIKEQVTTEKITHVFYCDDCGKLIMSSSEYGDGYYECPNEFTICGNRRIEGHYCNNCGNKRVHDIEAYLRAALNPHNLREE